jgi:pentatricopeptide repeat protein
VWRGLTDARPLVPQRMCGRGVVANVVSYGAAVEACARSGLWREGVALLDRLRRQGLNNAQVPTPS